MQKLKVLITGSRGMIGNAVTRQLKKYNYKLFTPTHQALDLCKQTEVMRYFVNIQPDYVFHLAAIVGGIHANNTFPAKFIYENTQMHCNVIQAAFETGVKKLLFPGSACTYPKFAAQPICEGAFLDGKIEPTNLAYGAAKINGIVMCQAYAKQYQLNCIIPMPTNAYGVGDNFSPESSHVIPALMRRIHEAKMYDANEIVLWGSGKPLREFIYVDDLADALIFLMDNYQSSDLINVGTMQEISIYNLATSITQIVGYQGKIVLDESKMDGAPRKCLDSTKLFKLGWQPKIKLEEGLRKMYTSSFQTNKRLKAASL